MTTTYKIIAALVLLAASFYYGMRVERAFNAERDLAIKAAGEAFKEVYQQGEAESAKRIDAKLDDIKSLKERLVIREIPKIITRDVYRNDCIDDDGLHIIESARRGEANTTNPP